ncbi:DMT family transporter [Pseudaquabacterium rugosum]|uniref:DMT family transporter n=1 Tax=Pseudaquabacterium rugosum TaxID=2984194 RepID=A0ABU9BDP5_9BURK
MSTPTPGLHRWQANALLLLAAVIWGSAFVGQALGMDGVGPLSFTALRFALGTLVVAPLAWQEHRRLRAQPRPADSTAAGRLEGRAALRWILALGTLLCAGVVLQQIGLMSTTVTNAGFLTALYVPLVPVAGWLLQRVLPHWSVWPAAVGCVIGTWLLTGGAGAGPRTLSAGDLWVLASALPWALHVLLVGQIANRLRGAYRLACGQFLVCTLLSAALACGLEQITADGLQRAAGAIVYTGVLSVGVGFTLQVIGQRHAPPADAAIVLSSETVFAALFGAWWMGDRLGLQGLAGCALILTGILWVQLAPLLRRAG